MAKLVKLSKKDIRNLLNRYEIGKYLSHKHIPWALGNSVYYLNTSKGRFILKIHQDIKLKKLKFVLKTMEYARSREIPVAETIKNKYGKLISFQDRKMITIQKFIKGKQINVSTSSIIKTTARTIGLLDKALLEIPLNGKSYGHYNLFGKLIYDKVKVNGFDFIKQEKELHKDLAKINAQKLRKSVIHLDFASSNLLYKGKRVIAILDWDDADENYLVYELAVILSYGFTTKNKILKDKVILFAREYQKHIKLNKEEKRALYYLIKARQLSAASWAARQLKLRDSKHDEGLKKLLNGYELFSKLSLEEFLSWIN
jgi:homoserine kinase type II